MGSGKGSCLERPLATSLSMNSWRGAAFGNSCWGCAVLVTGLLALLLCSVPASLALSRQEGCSGACGFWGPLPPLARTET